MAGGAFVRDGNRHVLKPAALSRMILPLSSRTILFGKENAIMRTRAAGILVAVLSVVLLSLPPTVARGYENFYW